MRAAFIRRYGGNDRVEIGEQPLPEVGPGDVLVAVKAASVNPLDFKIRQGKTRSLLPYRFPLVLGNDCAGIVATTGAAVRRFSRGDEVYVRLAKDRIGAFAEFAVADEAIVALKPAGTSFPEAASLPLVGLTSWQALVDLARLERGQRVLIHAGSGGVGSFAIQLARHLGAQVATTASVRNAALVRSLGADIVIDHHHERFEDQVGEVDVVLDTIGGEVQRRSLAVLRPGGVLVTIAGVPTPEVARRWGANAMVTTALWAANLRSRGIAKRRGVRFEYLFMRPDGEQLERIAALVEAGSIRAVVDRAFPLARAAEALAYSESGHAVGKVLVEP